MRGVHMHLFSEQRADVGLVRVVGEVDVATAPELLAALLHTIGTSRAVEVDLRRVTFIDCVGLRAVWEAERRACDAGCHFVLRRSRVVQRLERLVDGAPVSQMGDCTHGDRVGGPRS